MDFISGLVWTLMSQLGMALVTYGCFCMTRTGSGRADVLWFLILRWCIMGLVVICTGSAGILDAGTLGVLSIWMGAFSAIFWRLELSKDLTAIRSWVQERCQSWTQASQGTRAAVGVGLVLLSLVAIRTIFAMWFFAPYANDPTNYHLPKLASWMQTGWIGRPFFEDLRSYLPGGFQLIQVWWVVFFHHDVLIEMAGVEFLVFAGVTIYVLSRDCGFTRLMSALAGSVFVSMPVVMAQSTSCMNDLAVGALMLAVVRFAMSDKESLWQRVAIMSVAFMLGMSIKPTMLYLAPALVFMSRKSPVVDRPFSHMRVVVLLVALAPSLYWYLLNAMEFGNPFYPVGVEFMGWRPFNESRGILLTRDFYGSQQVGMSLESMRLNTSEFMQYRIYDAFAPYNNESSKQLGWGWCGMGIGMPCLILALVRGLLPWRMVAMAGTAFFTTFAAVQLDLWNMRFVAWCAVLPCMAIASVLPITGWIVRRGMLYLIFAGVLMNLVGMTALDRMGPENYRRTLSMSWHERSSATFGPRDIDLGNEPTLVIGVAYPLYSLYGPDYRRKVISIPSSMDIKPIMERDDMRNLIVGAILPPTDREIIRQHVASGYLVKVNDHWYVRRKP